MGNPGIMEKEASDEGHPTRLGFNGMLRKSAQLVKAAAAAHLSFSAQQTEASLLLSYPSGPYQGEGTCPSGWPASGHLNVTSTERKPLSAGARCGSQSGTLGSDESGPEQSSQLPSCFLCTWHVPRSGAGAG